MCKLQQHTLRNEEAAVEGGTRGSRLAALPRPEALPSMAQPRLAAPARSPQREGARTGSLPSSRPRLWAANVPENRTMVQLVAGFTGVASPRLQTPSVRGAPVPRGDPRGYGSVQTAPLQGQPARSCAMPATCNSASTS